VDTDVIRETTKRGGKIDHHVVSTGTIGGKGIWRKRKMGDHQSLINLLWDPNIGEGKGGESGL